MDTVKEATIRDELDGATLISQEKNVEEKQEMADFSSSIQDVMGENVQLTTQKGGDQVHDDYTLEQSNDTKMWRGKRYPLGLKKNQVEALLAGVAAIIGTSDSVQSKIADMVPQFYGESGKLSVTGMAILVLVVAIIFYFGKQFVMNR